MYPNHGPRLLFVWVYAGLVWAGWNHLPPAAWASLAYLPFLFWAAFGKNMAADPRGIFTFAFFAALSASIRHVVETEITRRKAVDVPPTPPEPTPPQRRPRLNSNAAQGLAR